MTASCEVTISTSLRVIRLRNTPRRSTGGFGAALVFNLDEGFAGDDLFVALARFGSVFCEERVGLGEGSVSRSAVAID